MLKKRDAQGLSITTIVVSVIALIVIVVIIAILTGRMGLFSSGLGKSASCENMCKAFGKVKFETPVAEGECEGLDVAKKPQLISGEDYIDVDEGYECCCVKKES